MNDGGRWLSKAAVLWVWDEAPDVPPSLLSTLLAVARFADEGGCGSFASASTLALLTRKTRRQVRRDLDELEKRGLLCRGNQQLVAYIRADRRPDVYDLPMSRGVTHDPSSKSPRGDMEGHTGGHGRSHEGSPMTPEEILNRSRKGARRAGAKGARAPACDRDGPAPHSNACRAGQTAQCGSDWCACRCHPWNQEDSR